MRRRPATWILEAPSLAGAQTTLAAVGTVAFGPTSTFTAGGVTSTVAAGDPTQIDGQSFDDCAYALGCAAP